MKKSILMTLLLLLLIPTAVHANPIIPLIEISAGVYSNCQRATIGHCIEVVGALLSIKDFDAVPITKSVNAVNCYESDPVQVKIHNPNWISDQDIYANEVKVGTVKANPPIFGQEQTVSFTFTPFQPTGEAKSKAKSYMTMKGVGVGIIDQDKTRSKLIQVEVVHIASDQELALWESSKELNQRHKDVAAKALFLSKKGTTIEDNTSPVLEKGVNAIKSCDFTSATAFFSEADGEMEKFDQVWEKEGSWTKLEYTITSNILLILLGLLICLGVILYAVQQSEQGPGVY